MQTRKRAEDAVKVVLDTDRLFKYTKKEQDDMKYEVIKASFEYHFANNEYYRGLCEEAGFRPENFNSAEDITKIPLIHQKEFKQDNPSQLFTVLPENTNFEIRSSGTSGVRSVTYRDNKTVDTVFIAFHLIFRELFEIENGAGLFLTPSIAEAPSLGMLRTAGVLNWVFNTQEYLMEGNEPNFEKGIDFLTKWEGKLPRHIFGPPFMLNFFLDYLKAKNIKLKLDPNTRIMTTGGWKRYTGQLITRSEMDEKCKEYLGVEPENIRDFYGAIESNILGVECEKRQKHIPPYAHFYLRDLADRSKLAEKGKEGAMAIIDPLNLSFPGFIMTDDVVLIDEYKKCECGRMGSLMDIIGRAPNAELKTCATTLEQYIDKTIDKM